MANEWLTMLTMAESVRGVCDPKSAFSKHAGKLLLLIAFFQISELTNTPTVLFHQFQRYWLW